MSQRNVLVPNVMVTMCACPVFSKEKLAMICHESKHLKGEQVSHCFHSVNSIALIYSTFILSFEIHQFIRFEEKLHQIKSVNIKE